MPLLLAHGHRAVAPTLVGSGSRSELLTPHVALDDHIGDVVDALRADREPAVLVVHSYAGMVAAAAVDRAPGLVTSVVFVDAFYPDRGDAAIDQMPAQFQESFRQRAAESGDGWRLPASETLLDVWGVHDAELRQWVADRLTDWSLRCFESPSPAPRSVLADLPRWYVGGGGDYPARDAFQAVADVAEADGCIRISLDTGHDVMLEQPDALADVVLAAAG